MEMRPNTRLIWCLIIIIGSALYALLVATNPTIASALMLGYVGVLLTIFVLNEVWRKKS
jgi:membrane protein YdbS with pleckstrin-like domain